VEPTKWDLAFLTELHGHDTNQNPAPEIMRIEEYTIIRFGNTRLTAQGRLDGAEISWLFSEGQQASAEILRCLKGRQASAEFSGDLISPVLDLFQLRTLILRCSYHCISEGRQAKTYILRMADYLLHPGQCRMMPKFRWPTGQRRA